MAENSEAKPTPINPDIEILPPNVAPIHRGAEPNKSRRALFKKIAGITAVLGLGAVGVASQTETGRKILKAAPIYPTPDSRPSLDQQKKEINQNINSQRKPASPETNPTQTKIQADIKATMDANPDNRYKPDPSNKSK